jgi:beta-glucosidase
MKLGLFDPPERVAYTKIPFSTVRSDDHRALALEMERASIVMLKNDGALPIQKKPDMVVAVVGPTADDRDVIVGNYNGTPYRPVTILDGICDAFGEQNVYYAQGCHLWRENRAGFTEAVVCAEAADVVVACMGLSPVLEGEEGEHGEDDRSHINLPGVQDELLQKLAATGKPVVLVLTGGSALAVNWADENVNAVLDAWYGGEAMGTAVADILTGVVSPSGRLPLTFYKSADDLPPFTDYAMADRTYRYFGGEPLYRFGFGLSYSTFEYSDLACASDVAAGEDLALSVNVTNAGDRDADEVVQVYASNVDAKVPVPLRQLVAFARVKLAKGEKKQLAFTVPAAAMSVIDDDGARRVHPTRMSIAVGGCQPGDAKAVERGVAEPVGVEVAVTGGVVEVER